MRRYYRHAQFFVRKNGSGIALAVAGAFVGTVLSVGAGFVIHVPEFRSLEAVLLGVILVALIFQTLIIRWNVLLRMDALEERFDSFWPVRTAVPIEERRRHWRHEKRLLCERLVHNWVPELLTKEFSGREVGLIVDAGSTLESFFDCSKQWGFVGVDSGVVDGLRIYTNSLSGCIAFSSDKGRELRDDQLHLLGGTPIEKYRAVVGPETERGLASAREDVPHMATIGFTTANWILVGASFDRLILCATEDNHLAFKQAIQKHSDCLVVVAPLAKLLPLNTVDEFNHLLKGEKVNLTYRGFDVTQGANSRKVLLATTERRSSESILHAHSEKLTFYCKDEAAYRSSNYTLLDRIDYEPNYPRDQQFKIEIPHHYMRSHSAALFGVPFSAET